MRIAVFSDNGQSKEQMKGILKGIVGIRDVFAFPTLDRFLEEVLYGDYFDYIVLDVEKCVDCTELEITQKIYEKRPLSKIILVIEDGRDYIEKIFLIPSNIVGVYQKPILDSRFEEMSSQIIEKNSPNEEKQNLVFRKRGEIYSVPVETILFLESRGHKVVVHTDTGRHCYYGKLETVKQKLSDIFLQCHKSYLVNMDKIVRIYKNSILLDNGEEIPISQTRYGDTFKIYSQYCSKQENKYIEIEEKEENSES